MKVLVTGAGGFLGRHVVEVLVRAGHGVRAMVRPSADIAQLGWGDAVEPFRADLRSHPDLVQAFDGIDAVVHLAAAMSGGDAARFADTMIPTERLFDAMAETSVRRLVLCSSFSVYDWLQAHGETDEQLPLRERPYSAGGYASAKVWQERLARRRAADLGWDLTILRPGYVWGDANPCPDSSYGRSAGALHLVFGPTRRPALTHVANCADCFRAALESPETIGQVINVVDDDAVSAWRFLGDHLERSGRGGRRLALPYPVVAVIAAALRGIARLIWGERAKLPSLIEAESFAEGYRPRSHSTERRRALLPGHTPIAYERCLELTYGSA